MQINFTIILYITSILIFSIFLESTEHVLNEHITKSPILVPKNNGKCYNNYSYVKTNSTEYQSINDYCILENRTNLKNLLKCGTYKIEKLFDVDYTGFYKCYSLLFIVAYNLKNYKIFKTFLHLSTFVLLLLTIYNIELYSTFYECYEHSYQILIFVFAVCSLQALQVHYIANFIIEHL